MNVPITANMHGMICGGCGHAWSNHVLSTKKKSERLHGKCKKCACNADISEA